MNIIEKLPQEILDEIGKLAHDYENQEKTVAETKEELEATAEWQTHENEKKTLKAIENEIKDIIASVKEGYQTKLFSSRKVKNITKGTSSSFLSPN